MNLVSRRLIFTLVSTSVISGCSLQLATSLADTKIVFAPPSDTPTNHPATNTGSGATGSSGGTGGNTVSLPPVPRPTPTPANIQGYGPADIQLIYHVNKQVYGGDGITICLVEAYNGSPQAISDAQVYAKEFSLPSPNVTIVPVSTTLTADTIGWYSETSLDIDMVMSVAPNAKILILNAVDAQTSSLAAAVALAPANKCNVVSMSYGGAGSSVEVTNQALYEVPGIAFFASTGDTTGIMEYPALQPGVVAVGGTTVTVSGSTVTETVWDDSASSGEGEGLDTLFPFPSYQKGFNTRATKQDPEVTAIGDPNTGVALYTNAKWQMVGGTSASSPLWASIMALVYEGRQLNKLSVIQDVHQAIYAGLSVAASSNFRDITKGCIGSNPTNCAAVGYDPVSGFGSPLADGIVSYLTSSAALGTATMTTFAP